MNRVDRFIASLPLLGGLLATDDVATVMIAISALLDHAVREPPALRSRVVRGRDSLPR
jgi:hypothetical protein